MKLIAKLFLVTTLVTTLAMATLGYLLMDDAFCGALQQQCDQVTAQYRFVCFSLRAQVLANGTLHTQEDFFRRLDETAGGYMAVYADGECMYSDFPLEMHAHTIPEEMVQPGYELIPMRDEYLLVVSGSFSQTGQMIFVQSAQNVTDIFRNVQRMQTNYRRIYCAAWAIAAALLFVLTHALTRPLDALAQAAQRMEKGQYDQQVAIRSDDEIGMLAKSFNSMAGQIQSNMAQLQESVEQKDRFVANFAHELKTPLTSVIGYADMLYQRPLDREKTREAAGYILSEGLRLEALSLKLMDMIVLEKQSFVLEWLSARELFDNIAHTLDPVCRKKGVQLRMEIDDGEVYVEFDLFKTLILNLVDNSMKAEAKCVTLQARGQGEQMHICVEDDGIGIAQEELSKITEAFYMVDKSRARRQHGAGLGLALCARIAQIHQSELHITSQQHVYCRVCLTLKRQEGEA
jgi:signal transduction histidine kinase